MVIFSSFGREQIVEALSVKRRGDAISADLSDRSKYSRENFMILTLRTEVGKGSRAIAVSPRLADPNDSCESRVSDVLFAHLLIAQNPGKLFRKQLWIK